MGRELVEVPNGAIAGFKFHGVVSVQDLSEDQLTALFEHRAVPSQAERGFSLFDQAKKALVVVGTALTRAQTTISSRVSLPVSSFIQRGLELHHSSRR